jgi:hypothetical protein
MLSLFTYGLTYGVAEAQSDTKELGLKLTSFRSFDQSTDAANPSNDRPSEHPRNFFRNLFRRWGGG